MENKTVKNLLIYNHGSKCWLNGVISKENKLTLHHIKPLRKQGKTAPENGALLTEQRHQWFNLLEQKYPKYAEKVNAYFLLYKGNYPDEIIQEINQYFALVEPPKIKRKR